MKNKWNKINEYNFCQVNILSTLRRKFRTHFKNSSPSQYDVATVLIIYMVFTYSQALNKIKRMWRLHFLWCQTHIIKESFELILNALNAQTPLATWKLRHVHKNVFHTVLIVWIIDGFPYQIFDRFVHALGSHPLGQFFLSTLACIHVKINHYCGFDYIRIGCRIYVGVLIRGQTYGSHSKKSSGQP